MSALDSALTPRDRTIRDLALKAKAELDAETVDIADTCLSMGLSPDLFRAPCPPVAWAMDDLIHQEKKIRKVLRVTRDAPVGT